MAATASADAGHPDLTEKQQTILAYLRDRVSENTYFKSKYMADDLDMSAKEIGVNIKKVQEAVTDLTIEPWAYTGGTTWKITA